MAQSTNSENVWSTQNKERDRVVLGNEKSALRREVLRKREFQVFWDQN